MDLKNGYKKVYEATIDTKINIYASKTGTCDPKIDTDLLIDRKPLSNGALIYENKGRIYITPSGIPSFDADGNSLDTNAAYFNEVIIEKAAEPMQASVNPDEDPENDPEKLSGDEDE